MDPISKTEPAFPQVDLCVGDVTEFLERFWARKPMHRPSADDDGFADLLSWFG